MSVATKTYTTDTDNTLWLVQTASHTASLPDNGRHKSEPTGVWSYDFHETSYPLILLSPELIAPDSLPPNHPIWDEVDAILEKIWAESTPISVAEDDAWLDEIRSSWDERIEELYDGFDTWE